VLFDQSIEFRREQTAIEDAAELGVPGLMKVVEDSCIHGCPIMHGHAAFR
jgi:hypothetical protein